MIHLHSHILRDKRRSTATPLATGREALLVKRIAFENRLGNLHNGYDYDSDEFHEASDNDSDSDDGSESP